MTPEQLLGPLNDVEAKYAPPVLYVEGHPRLISKGPRVAIVGSRDASERGLARAASLAVELARHNVTVVSGLARGIDASAQWAAVNAGGRSFAVLGTPLDVCTPIANKPLQDLIMKEHLAISQFAAGSRVYKSNFPRRNRTMALISHASIIVEAGEGSGTLSQGWEALRLGRPLFIDESVFEDDALDWPAEMLDYGARILWHGDLGPVYDVLPVEGPCVLEDAF